MQSLVVLSATPVALALPVLSRPPHAHAVAPKVSESAVIGVDAASARALPGWGTLAGPTAARPLALTRGVRSASFSALGVTWAGGDGEYEVAARVRQDGRWTGWHALDADADHGPDDTNPADNAATRGGTAPWYTGPADGWQVRVGVRSGRAPRDVRVSLVDPGTSAADGAIGASPTLSPGSVADASIGQPSIVTRAQWGADESLRTGSPSYGDTIKMGFVHHTDTSNSYTSTQAAAMVRSVYAYHVRSRGWSDIGYNFLVDKYGRVFEGRYGGVARPVIGAHTGGFNTDTFGVSLLGTYTSLAPTSGQLSALERTFAWKMGLHYVNPLAKTTLTSAGGSKYAKGVRVTFNNVSGHRDAGLTSCPGNQTYSRLGTIRSAIKSYMGASLYAPTVSATSVTYLTSPSSVTVRAAIPTGQAWRLVVRNHRSGTVQRTVTGTATTAISAVWNLRDANGLPVTPDTYDVELQSWTARTTARPFKAQVAVRSALPSAVSVARLNGTPYAMVDAGRLYGVSAPLARALRPQPSATGYYGSVSALAAPSAPARDGMFVRNGAGTTWVVVDGVRHQVTSSVVTALGLTSPRTLSDAVLALLPAGPGWTDTTRHPDGAVVTTADGAWRLENGVRRPFTSPASRSAWTKYSAVAAALPGDLARPLGAPLAPPEGVVLRTATGAGVVSGGTFRPVSSGFGYDIANAALATAEDLAALPAGAPLDNGRHPSGTLLRNGSGYVEVLGATGRPVAASLVATDPRRAVTPFSGEIASLPGAAWLPPSGVAGRALDGTVRVVESGRLVALSPAVAASLGYDSVSLPALETADFGPLPVGASLAASHPAGSVVTDGTAFWVLDAGTRRPLAASLVAAWLGRPALPAASADLALPEGPAAPPATGALVVTPDGATWLVEGEYRHAVAAAVAHRLGLDKVSAVPVVAADLTAATKLGSAIA